MKNRELKIKLPPELKDFFEQTGYTESTFFESRRNGRLRIRAEGDITLLKNLPSLPRKENEFLVLIKDVSQRGLCLLTHKQLFPLEEFSLSFNARVIDASIVRCRRINELCYECGAEIQAFKNLEDDADLQNDFIHREQ
jgi:hypothetical protein